MNRAARSMRSGSSPKLTSGLSGVRSVRVGEVGRAAERIDERRQVAAGVGELERHRVHGEVASRQVDVDAIGELDIRLARVVVVDLCAVGGDLVDAIALLGADRAEPLALGPDGVGPPVEAGLDLRRHGVGGRIEVALA